MNFKEAPLGVKILIVLIIAFMFFVWLYLMYPMVYYLIYKEPAY